jgi:hypothetical protein
LREEATINNIKVIHIVGAAVEIQYRGFGIAPKAASATLMRHGLQRNLIARIEAKGMTCIAFRSRISALMSSDEAGAWQLRCY